MNDKRGVSELIATVLVIGITIAAIGIVYVFVIPFIRDGIQAQKACSDVQLYVNTMGGYTCYDSSTQNVNVQVKRGPEEADISGIQVIVYGEGNAGILSLIENSSASSYKEIKYAEGLAGYWSFDNVEGNVVFDDSGKGNDGTLIGGATITPGKFDNACSFNAKSQYLGCNNASMLNTALVTVAAWVYPVNYSGTLPIADKYQSSPTGGWSLTSNVFQKKWTFSVWNGGSSDTATDTAILSFNTWTFLVGVFDGTAVRLYKNGILVNSDESVHSSSIDDSHLANLDIGKSGSTVFFNGTIDEIAIWNKNLNYSEIQDIYQNGMMQEAEVQDKYILQPNAQKVYEVNLLSVGLTSADSVSVAPVVRIGNKNHVCNAVPEVTLSEC